MSKVIVELSELCDVITKGTTPSNIGAEFTEKGIKYIRSEMLTSAKYISDEGLLYISEETHKKLKRSQLKPGDILFSMAGVYLGKTAILRECDTPANTNQAVALIRIIDEKCNREYVYYYLNLPEVVKSVNSITGQSAQPNINLKQIGNIQIMLPERSVQDAVVTILSTYDSLIANNQKQIKLLEEAAQRLYKEWFVDLRFPGHETTPIVDGVPEGWASMAMNGIAEYINGYAFKPSDWGTKGKPIIKIKEMGSGITADTPRNSGESIPTKYIVTAGDILFSWSATLSAMIWDEEDGLLNQHLFKVIPHNGISREFILQSILKALDEFSNLTTGSTMKHIQRGKLKEVFVNVPDNVTMRKYESISEPMREQILTLKKQIILLKEARDRLLPKLMSGEIEV